MIFGGGSGIGECFDFNGTLVAKAGKKILWSNSGTNEYSPYVDTETNANYQVPTGKIFKPIGLIVRAPVAFTASDYIWLGYSDVAATFNGSAPSGATGFRPQATGSAPFGPSAADNNIMCYCPQGQAPAGKYLYQHTVGKAASCMLIGEEVDA